MQKRKYNWWNFLSNERHDPHLHIHSLPLSSSLVLFPVLSLSSLLLIFSDPSSFVLRSLIVIIPGFPRFLSLVIEFSSIKFSIFYKPTSFVYFFLGLSRVKISPFLFFWRKERTCILGLLPHSPDYHFWHFFYQPH